MKYKHPAEKYVIFMLTAYRAKKHDNDWVRKRLAYYGLPGAEDDYLDQLRGRIDPPRPFYPKDLDHEPSRVFLESWGVSEMHEDTNVISRINSVLLNQMMRRQIEVCLLGNVPAQEISERISHRFELEVPPEVIRMYAYYYHDVKALSLGEWAEINHHYEDRHDREMALNCGPNMALHRLGFQAMIETKTIMRKFQQAMYFDFMALDRQPMSRQNVAMKVAIAKTAIKLDERLSQSDVALREVLDQFKKFQMQQDETKVASIEELTSQGSHSNSGAMEEDHG